MPSPITVDVKVTPLLKEFVMCTHGTDVYELQKHDFISSVIWPKLKLVPRDYNIIRDRTLYIRLRLLWWSEKSINVLYRNYLDDVDQHYVRQHLHYMFKKIFHAHVSGYISSEGWSKGVQKEAVEDFCKIYKLTMDSVNFEMLVKSWNRSEEKIRLMNYLGADKIQKHRSDVSVT